MHRFIHSFSFFLFLGFVLQLNAQDTTFEIKNDKLNINETGYYQSINLDAITPCNCNEKTQRTYDLAKGLRPSDVREYKLHAFKFKFGTSTVAASKLFKAFENDPSVFKVSVKEWDSFMLLTTGNFNALSFETAAKQVFESISPMLPEDFLKIKNLEAYNEYLQWIEKNKNLNEESALQKNGTN